MSAVVGNKKDMEKGVFFDVDYNVGDIICSKENPDKEIGTCTGFRQNDTCIEINGKCWGGRTYFMKSEWAEYVILDGE